MATHALRKEIQHLLPTESVEAVIETLEHWGKGVSHARSCSVYRAAVALCDGKMSELRALIDLLQSDDRRPSLLLKWNAIRNSIAESPQTGLTWFADYVPAIASVALRFQLYGETSHGSLMLRTNNLPASVFVVPLARERKVYITKDRTALLAPKSSEGMQGVAGVTADETRVRNSLLRLIEGA